MVQISNMLIPALIFYIVAMGLSQKKDIYARLLHFLHR